MNPSSHDPAYPSEQPSRGERVVGSVSAASAPSEARTADIDRDLLRRVATGDEFALGTLYDRWSPLVHALVLRMLGDADEAEDVVEETFWQAWRHASRYEVARGAVSTWLTTIARSRALDRLRARRRRQEDSWTQLEEREVDLTEQPARHDDPLTSAESAERRRRVASALAALPAEQRQAIELAYFGGFSQSEIAERTGQPLGTVKTRVRLAMDKLRESLSIYREGAK